MDNDIKFICFIIIVILMAAVTIIALIMNIEETKAEKKATKATALVSSIKSQISEKEAEVRQYKEQLKDKRVIIDLLELLNACDHHISYSIEDKPEFINMKHLIYEIEAQEKIIKQLFQEIQSIEKQQSYAKQL